MLNRGEILELLLHHTVVYPNIENDGTEELDDLPKVTKSGRAGL